MNNEILYSNYIKYDRLYHMCMKAFYNRKNINTVDIMIDMNSLTKCLYRYPKDVPDPRMIASSMINLCAHLRQYFRSRHNVNTKIYIVYAGNRPKAAVEIDPSYNAHAITRMNANVFITQSIMDACELLKSICPYLFGTYFIKDDNFNETAIIMDYLIDGAIGDYTIIYSKDPYCYQLVAMCDNTCLFRPRKTKTGDDTSFVVLKSNIFDVYREEELRHKPINVGISINHELFSMMIALSGFKYRDIPSLFNNAIALKNIKNAVENKQILNKYNGVMTVDPFVLRVNPIANEDLFNKFRMLDLIYQYIGANIIPEEIDCHILDLYDHIGIQAINNTEFKEFPLDLNNL